jgi:hypothetical protein
MKCILMATCRQVYVETCLLTYALNNSWVDDAVVLRAWLKLRLPEQTVAVKRLTTDCFDCANMSYRLLPSLVSVRVYCVCDGTHSDKPAEGQKLIEEVQKIWGSEELEVLVEPR